MTWALLLLRLKSALSAAVGVFTRYPMQCAIAALLCLSAWLWNGRQHALARIAEMQAAEQTNAAATKTLRTQEAHTYQEKASVADQNHAAGLGRARALTSDHVDAQRVLTARYCRPAEPIGQADPAGQPQELPAGFVLVAESDVRRAADWQAYGVAMHDWALSITGDK